MPKWTVNSFRSGKWKFNDPIYREVIWIVTRCKNSPLRSEELPIIFGSLSKIQLLFHKHFNQNQNVWLGSVTFDFKELVKFLPWFKFRRDLGQFEENHQIGLPLTFSCKSLRYSMYLHLSNANNLKEYRCYSKFSHQKFIVLKAHGAQAHTPWNRHYSNLIYACDLHIDI